jgi:AcrR family transcriptional regulator
MGRKAVAKSRINNPHKTEQLVILLTDTFKKHGTRKYTMETIAAELNISKSTLYQYFSTKDEMVTKVLMNFMEGLLPFEANLKDTSLSFKDRYYKNLDLFSTALSEISTIFLEDIKTDYPNIWKQIEQFNQYVATVAKDFYEAGIEAGAFTDLNSAVMAETDKLFFNMITDVDFLYKNGLTVNDVFENFYRMKIYGILKK